MLELLQLFLVSIVFFVALFATVRLFFRFLGFSSQLKTVGTLKRDRDQLFSRLSLSYFLVPTSIYLVLYSHSEIPIENISLNNMVIGLFVLIVLSSFVFLARAIGNK